MTNVYWPLQTPDSLGGLTGADDVRDAVKATILEWSPFYIATLSERLANAGLIGQPQQVPYPLPAFGTWVTEPDRRNFGSGQPAAFLSKVTGTVGEPDVQGNGQVIATWRSQVTVQVFGTTWEEAADLGSYYEKVVRWCILQHRSLGGFAMSTKWKGETFNGTLHTGTRTVGEVVMAFDVKVGNVIDISRGPAEVPSPPVIPADDPTVESTSVTVTEEPI